MSITVNEDRIEIGIPRAVKRFANQFSDAHDLKKLYKKVYRRNKRLEAALTELNKVYGNEERFKAIMEDEGVQM